jgi:3-hydroxyisobutyrate dehydrogenase-like beta-hydroxyacid dehydrogenase
MSRPVLGFIGLGRMGTPMVRNLLASGYSVHAYDPQGAALATAVNSGAIPAASPRAVAIEADIVLICLPSPEVVREVLVGRDGVSSGARAHIVIDLSTTGPRVAKEMAAALGEKNIVLVDSPVSGGVAGAIKGTLALMVACSRAIFSEVEPVLAPIGKLFFVGEKPGLGQTLKLANNLLNVAAMAISSEAMVMGVKAGLDPKTMIEVINVSSGRNSATQDKFPKHIIPRTFDFGFSTALAYKDVRLCIDEAETLGVPMVVGGAVRQFLAMANATCGPATDFTQMVQMVENWADVEVKANN